MSKKKIKKNQSKKIFTEEMGNTIYPFQDNPVFSKTNIEFFKLGKPSLQRQIRRNNLGITGISSLYLK